MYPRLSKHRHLFIDDKHIETGRSAHRYGCHNLKRIMHQPEKQGLVVVPDSPHESPVLQTLSNNVIFEPETGKFRMWYSCFERRWYEPLQMEVESCFVLYAESSDGVKWEKPELGLFEAGGTKKNNICLKAEGCGIMWAGVMLDREAEDPAERYKLLGHGTVGKDHGVVVYFSPDGIHWTAHLHNPVHYARVESGDSHTLMPTRDPRSGRFVAGVRPVDWYLSYPEIPYYRYDRGDPQDPVKDASFSHRRVGLSFSDDFTHWGTVHEVLEADLDDPPSTQMQGMTFSAYEDLYLGFIIMHYADGIDDTIDIQMAVSRDLESWQRVGNRKPFLPIGPEGEWDSQMIFSVSNAPIRVGNELYLYYNAHKTTHYCDHKDRYGAVGLAKLRVDGFVSMFAEGEGFLVTTPFEWRGQALRINADGSKGELRVQLMTEALEPIEGYISESICSDVVDQVVCWPEGKAISDLKGRPVRLKFLMRNCHIYSFSEELPTFGA